MQPIGFPHSCKGFSIADYQVYLSCVKGSNVSVKFTFGGTPSTRRGGRDGEFSRFARLTLVEKSTAISWRSQPNYRLRIS